MTVEKAIIGIEGGELTLINKGQGSKNVELWGKDDSEVWLLDADDNQLPFIFLRPGLAEPGRRLEVELLTGEKFEGSFIDFGTSGLAMRGAKTIVIPQKALKKLTFPDAIALPVVSFDNPGVAQVRFRTSTLASNIRSLFIVYTGRVREENEPSMVSETLVEITNRSEKAYSIKEASIVTHYIRSASRDRSERMEMMSAAPQAMAMAPKTASSEADVFTAELTNIEIAPYSTISTPLGEWNFICDVVTTLHVNYVGYPIYLSDARTEILVTSADDRLFPGGQTSIVVDDAEVSDRVTQPLAKDEKMLIQLFPNQRVTAKAENVHVMAPISRVAVVEDSTAEEPTAEEPMEPMPLAEKFQIIDFEVVIEVHHIQKEEQILLELDEEVLETNVEYPFKTKSGDVYYPLRVAPKSKMPIRAHFQVRIPVR